MTTSCSRQGQEAHTNLHLPSSWNSTSSWEKKNIKGRGRQILKNKQKRNKTEEERYREDVC